jgi:phage terminase small subunit
VTMTTKTGRGGARLGAGRPLKAPYPLEGALNRMTFDDPLAFLAAAMNDPSLDLRLRVDAAKSMLVYLHPRVGEGGKKDQREDAAKKAAKGKFSPARSPKLVVDNVKQL